MELEIVLYGDVPGSADLLSFSMIPMAINSAYGSRVKSGGSDR
jgi:hypothetical protein